ncbi:MAG: isoprenylcysteine carboxyl methyltransferase [Proteobacteria bacterium]|nr:isoprenylcysteine carboxyl methyltransferase [Pseudomonadota bacterium]
MNPKQPPKSATSVWITLVGALCGVAMMFWLRTNGVTMSDAGYAIADDAQLLRGFCLLIGSVIVPIVLLEAIFLKTWRRPSTGLDWDRPARWSLKRTMVKTIGLAATLAVPAFFYWALGEYNTPYYSKFYMLILAYGIYPLALAVPYIAFVDSRMTNPYDAYWQLGMWVLGRPRLAQGKIIRQHVLGWLVKGFFLPLMVVFTLDGSLRYLLVVNFDWVQATFAQKQPLLVAAIYMVDVVFGALGYMMTFRLLDSHIRSTEPTFLGWGVALMCYPPIWSGFNTSYLTYQGGGFRWDVWLAEGTPQYMIWGILILFCVVMYAWATVIFGLRFSNLTHRGIITNGPYRLTKHPAYVSKNLSWWLVSVPFVPHMGWAATVKFCLALLLVNFVYFMRARTEERHLSADRDYVQYALYMNDHSLFSFMGRLFPRLRYQPPAGYSGK